MNKVENFLIYGETGSQAEVYSAENELYFNDMPIKIIGVKGDVTGDGKVNSADLLKLKKYLLGLIENLD